AEDGIRDLIVTGVQTCALPICPRYDPSGRMALLARTYRGPLGRSRRHEPFARAATSFMRWQAERGVLRPIDGTPPGSRWWRAVKIGRASCREGVWVWERAGGER